nr:copia protein [Tanacetum cinerariifolium]
MMAEIYQAFKGQSSLAPSGSVTPTLALTYIPVDVEGENATNTATEEPPSHTERETEDPKWQFQSHKFNLLKMVYLIEQEIQEYLDKEEKMKKASEEEKLLAMYKPEVIKVVREEAKKLGINLKEVVSTKAGEKFKKAQDAEHEVLKKKHSKKVKRIIELNKRRVEEYMWTMTNRIKPDPINDIKIHPNTKPIVVCVFRNNGKRNFECHNPFKFTNVGITKLDELGVIIQKKKNSIVKDLMISLSKRYERLKKIPKELGIQSALPAPVPEKVSSQTSGRKRKHMELEHEIKVPRLECNRSLPEGVPFVNNKDDIYKVGVDSIVSYLVMASMVKTKENVRFSLKLRKLITDHPDQEKLKSKKVKLEALRYHVE